MFPILKASCLIALSCIAASGCRKPTAPNTIVAPGVAITEDKGQGSVKVETGGATIESANDGGSVALPENFPTDVPIYKGARVTVSSTTPQGMTVGLETDAAPPQVISDYKQNLAAQGWKIGMTTTAAQGGMVQGQKEKRFCTVAVGERSKTGKTVVSITVMESKK